MADRFLALIGLDEVGRHRCRSLSDAACREHGLLERLAQPAITVMADPAMPFRPSASGHSLVLGRLFEAGATLPDAPDRLDDAVFRARGEPLLRRYWGGYVAVSHDPASGGGTVLRDPSAAVPVYFMRGPGLLAFTSDLSILRTLELAPFEMSWDFVTHHLAFPELRLGTTGVSSVRELLAGQAAIVTGGRVDFRAAWTPGGYARQASRQTFEEAAAAVGQAVHGCVRAMAREHRRLALQLSGGLDSSIVAGCLRGAGIELACINLATPGRDGDERTYASAVAEAGGWPLQVLVPEPRPIEIGGVPAGLRPGPRILFRDIFHLQSEAAAASGAAAMFTGGGGDNVFGHLVSPILAADRLASHGPGPAFWRSAAEVAEIGGATTWAVAARAVRGALVRRSMWRPNPRFLAAGAFPAKAPRHVWRRAGGYDLPGRTQRIDAIIGVQSLLDPAQRPSAVPMQHPLLAQPVIEACLRTPTWHWVRGGVDRAVARAAFRDVLPEVVRQRRGKGSLSSYFSEVYRLSRPRLAKLLVDGALAERGLIDVAAVRSYLDQPGPPRDHGFYRLFDLADVEVWLRAWSGG
jgi:asparagine synthase (glutamine-hydrolysing)